ncbi:class I SAM-dependent methyltransferase [Tsukamurella spumae]|uniref:Class I SAM-dependent methyltransferase n=2 Tax=Tsukamurella spumae TaxID=44753 RepID=A0A846X6K5_9ACTN|nr:class I SAM-dependent methyltransferase [Tsukamurella spumae]
MSMIDALAAGSGHRWSDGGVHVSRVRRGRPLSVRRDGRGWAVQHRLAPKDLRDSLALRIAAEAGPCAVEEFERMLVGVVRTTVPGATRAWVEYYRNSMADLESGVADFAPVHATAAELLVGDSLLDLGSCFGFFALRAARSGMRVTATDLCAGTMTLLDTVAREIEIPLSTRVADATNTGLPDRYADTVSALHLLEHVPPEAGAAVLDEALRLARERVIIAVPIEEEPDTRYGHVRTFTVDGLHDLVADRGLRCRSFEHHGAWLVVDL